MGVNEDVLNGWLHSGSVTAVMRDVPVIDVPPTRNDLIQLLLGDRAIYHRSATDFTQEGGVNVSMRSKPVFFMSIVLIRDPDAHLHLHTQS